MGAGRAARGGGTCGAGRAARGGEREEASTWGRARGGARRAA